MNQSQEKQSKKINMKYFWGHFSAINLFLVAMHKAAVLCLEDVILNLYSGNVFVQWEMTG